MSIRQVEAAEVDLNSLLLTKFEEYLAWLTRYTDLNGTIVDMYDFTQLQLQTSNIILSTPIILMDLANMYEQTSNEFYLAMLQTFVDGIKNNSMNYVMASGVGEVFFATSYYFSGAHYDPEAIHTGIIGFVATKLFLWTGKATYKDLADRIADESLNKLAVVNNSTDLAWSAGYHVNRDLDNAKKGVNRQGYLGWFYALYGKHINSTYSGYVPRIFNWIWRAQINNEGLAYSIGDSTPSSWYTAYCVYTATNSYLVNSSLFSSVLKQKIANAIVYVKDKGQGSYNYQQLYFNVGAFASAWKTDYFVNNISIPMTKSMIYTALNSFHLTDKGFITRLEGNSFGFRFQQFSVTGLFTAYPLPESSFDLANYNGFIPQEFATGKYYYTGYTGAIYGDEWRDGRANWGVMNKASVRFLAFTRFDLFDPLPTASVTNYGYYWKSLSQYGSPYNVEVTAYVYPTGVFVGDIAGTNTPYINLEKTDLWTISAENGTSWTITSLTSGSNYVFGERLLIWHNTSNPKDRVTYFVKAQTNEWKYESVLDTYIKLSFAQAQTNHRVIYMTLYGWGTLIKNSSTAFSVMKDIVDSYDTTQPLSYNSMFDLYHNKIASLQPEASWNTLYKSAQASEVKLIGHSSPQTTSISAWSYKADKLATTINASSGQSTTTKIYCGDKGIPNYVLVDGVEKPINYDSSLKILTVNVQHSGPAEIILDWRLPTVMGLSLDPASVKIGASLMITANLVAYEGGPMADQTIRFFVGATELSSAQTDSSGDATISYVANVDAGTHEIKAMYDGNANYSWNLAAENLIVFPLYTTLNVSAPSVTVGAPARLTATLVDENKNPVTGANITFYIYENDTWKEFDSSMSNSVGQALTAFTKSVWGEYGTMSIYNGSTNFVGSNATKMVVVNPIFTNLTIFTLPTVYLEKPVRIEITLHDENGNPLEGKNVNFFLLEEATWRMIDSSETGSDGVALIFYTPLATSTYTVRAVFNRTDIYAESINVVTFDVQVLVDYTDIDYFVYIVVVIIVLCGIVAFGFLFRRRKRKKKAVPSDRIKAKRKK